MWKVNQSFSTKTQAICNWKKENSMFEKFSPPIHLTATCIKENWTLHIEAAKKQDSGHYILQITYTNGTVYTVQFNVSVFGESPGLVTLPL